MYPYEFPDRWTDLRRDDEAHHRRTVEDELRREVGPGHVLWGLNAVAIARCAGHCDDALFAIGDGRFAQVHLSYVRDGPDRPPAPDTDVLENWSAVEAYITEHEEW